jgi:hypothetical protein
MPRCYFCGSHDTMPPFQKSRAVFLLSWILPIQWRFCRKCARHFLTIRRRRSEL